MFKCVIQISCLSVLVCFCTSPVLHLLASVYAECVRVGFGGVKMCPSVLPLFFSSSSPPLPLPPVSSILSPSVALIVSVASHDLPASQSVSNQFFRSSLILLSPEISADYVGKIVFLYFWLSLSLC